MFQFYFVGYKANERNLLSTLNILLDAIATLFVLWIILDGLDWRTYIPVYIFCIFLPAGCNLFSNISFRMKHIWVRRVSNTSVREELDAAASTALEYLACIWAALLSGAIYLYENTGPVLGTLYDSIVNGYIELRNYIDRSF